MAGYVNNRIPENSRIFSNGASSLWNSSTTLGTSALVSRFANEGSLTASLSSGDIISFNRDIYTELPISQTVATDGINDDGDTFMVGFWIKSNKAISFTYTVSLLYPTSTLSSTPVEQHEQDISITSGEWVFVEHESRVTDPNDAYNYPISFSITVTDITGGGNADIYISFPIIWASLDFINNPILLDIYSKLPEFVRNQDSVATPFPFTLARFIEMCILHQGEMQQILTDIMYTDIAFGKDDNDPTTLSQLTDPSVAPREYIFWMAQFAGTKLINPTTGVTPWGNLPSTWQGIDMLDDADSEFDSSAWNIIQDSNPEPVGLDAFLEWQVSTGFYGVNAGSLESIKESVRRVLTGDKYVFAFSGGASPGYQWTVFVQTRISETPDSALLSVNDSVPSILKLIEPARPLGVIITHQLVEVGV
jgi:hypothetical protein